MHNHKFTRLAVALALTLTLAACQEGEGGGDRDEDVPGGNVEEEVQDEDNPDD